MSSSPWQDTRVSMVRDAHNTATSSETIGNVLEDIRSGEWAEQVVQIKAAYAAGGKEAAKLLKERILPGFLASGRFKKRANDKLTKHSGLLCCDLDECPNIEEVRRKLANDPFIAAFFYSPTWVGLKVILRIRPDASLHLRSFLAAREHFRRGYAGD